VTKDKEFNETFTSLFFTAMVFNLAFILIEGEILILLLLLPHILNLRDLKLSNSGGIYEE
jgi:hypothetical protein